MSLGREYVEELLCMPYGELIKECHHLRQENRQSCDLLMEERKKFRGAYNKWQNKSLLSEGHTERLDRCLKNIDILHTWTRDTMNLLDEQMAKYSNKISSMDFRIGKMSKQIAELESENRELIKSSIENNSNGEKNEVE